MNEINELSKHSSEGEAPKSEEQRADEIIDAVIAAAQEINPQIEKNLHEQTGGSLSDEAHKKNPLDEAHLLSLELKHPEADPLMAMIEKLNDESLRELVMKLIDTGELSSDEKGIVRVALADYLKERKSF